MTRDHWSEHELSAALRGEGPQRVPELAVIAAAARDLLAASSGMPPPPSAALAYVLDHGPVAQRLSAEKGDLPVTAASNAPGSAWQASGLPKRRRIMIVEWMAGLSLAAKVGLGVTVAVASVAGAGAAGVLPGPAQEAFASVSGTDDTAGQDAAEAAAEEAERAAELAAKQAEELADAPEDAAGAQPGAPAQVGGVAEDATETEGADDAGSEDATAEAESDDAEDATDESDDADDATDATDAADEVDEVDEVTANAAEDADQADEAADQAEDD